MLLPTSSLLNLNRGFRLNFGFHLGLQLQYSSAERLVDRNLLAKNLEADHKRVACSCLGVAAPTAMPPYRDAKILGQGIGFDHRPILLDGADTPADVRNAAPL